MGLMNAIVAGKRISTRLPSSKAAQDMPFTDQLVINRQAIEQTPRQFQINADYVSQYPTVRTKAKTAGGKVDAFTAQAVDNLIWLYNNAPESVKSIGKNWYVGANRIAQELAEKYDVSHESASAVLAALSPQKDWYQNVSLAERVLSSYKKAGDKVLDKEAFKTAQKIYDKPQYADDVKALKTKPFNELTGVQKAMYVRSYDQAFNDRSYQIINPNGDRVGVAYSDVTGKKNTTAWGSNSEIAKAISVIEDQSIENISAQMGGAHKVRNFFNNISNPQYAIDNPDIGDVTIDTHAVAADQISPFSGNSPTVGAAFGTQKGVASAKETGARGTFGFHADAYRIAARELGIQPRELQSVTWETIRSLFPKSFKTKSNVDEINQIWELHKKGQISAGLARELILDKAGGIPDPDWAKGPNSGLIDLQGNELKSGELPVSGISAGQGRGGSDIGRKLLSAGVPVGIVSGLGLTSATYSPQSEAGVVSGVEKAVSGLLKQVDDVAAGRGVLQGSEGQTFLRPQDEITARVYDNLRSQLPSYGETVYDQVPVGENAGVLGRSGATGVTRFRMPEQYAGQLSKIGRASPDLIEIKPDNAGAKLFADSMQRSKEGNKYGASVYVYPQDEYKNMRLFVTEDGTAGYALKPDGDIVSAFSYGPHKGVAQNILLHAIEQGGTKLDAFDTVLPDLYSTMGFREGGRLRWDESQAPEDWSKETFQAFNRGEPDVSFMGYDQRPSTPVRPNYVETYDEALQAQQGLINYADQLSSGAMAPQQANIIGSRLAPTAAAGLIGAGAMAPEDAEASLVGIGSTIGRKAEDMLGMAQKMRDVGMSPKEIWEKTGWEFNEVDKRWRTEHPNYDNTKINMPQGEGVYPIRDVVNDPDLMSAYDNYDYQDRVAKFNEFPDQQSLLDYRRLAFNRGSLNDLAINITPELEAGDGALNGNYIDIGAGSTPDQFRDIVLHELQHAIQQRENFAAGSSPELFARVQGRQVMDELNDRPYELKKKAYEDVIGRASAYLDNPPSDATVGTMTEARNTLDEFTNRLRLLEQYNKDSLGGSRSAVNMYRATAGEVEARNVEKRDAPRRLTREYGPVESEDIIDRNQQIYLDSSGAPYFTPRDGELQPTIFKTGSTEKPLGLLGLGAFGAGAVAPEDAEAATGYKLFRQVDGKLYPLFVNRSTEVPMGEWLKAEAGELTPEGKVKSSLGPLAYRPGWHAGDLPIATHIGGKSGPVKAPNYRPNDQVWAEVEFPEDVDWQAIANANATRNKAGEIIPRTAQITDQVPYGGFYRYKTNPNMTGEWMIGGDMKVNRVLSDEEVQAINEASGVADLPRLQSIKDKTMLATPIAGAGLMAALAPDQVQAQELDPNLPLTIGSPKQEVNYETMPSYYDYGDGATIPVRPPEPVRETKPEYLPAGMPVNPYTFMMSQGATQGEAARAQAEAISEAGRGLANQVGGIGGEMETLGKGLLYAITGQSLGGSPFSRFMHVLNNYDPQLPNVKDVEQLPPVMPELYPLDEESRRIMNMFGGLISPL